MEMSNARLGSQQPRNISGSMHNCTSRVHYKLSKPRNICVYLHMYMYVPRAFCKLCSYTSGANTI